MKPANTWGYFGAKNRVIFCKNCGFCTIAQILAGTEQHLPCPQDCRMSVSGVCWGLLGSTSFTEVFIRVSHPVATGAKLPPTEAAIRKGQKGIADPSHMRHIF